MLDVTAVEPAESVVSLYVIFPHTIVAPEAVAHVVLVGLVGVIVPNVAAIPPLFFTCSLYKHESSGLLSVVSATVTAVAVALPHVLPVADVPPAVGVIVPVTKPTFQVKAFCVTLFAVIVSEVDNAAYAIAIPKIDVIAINNANL